MKLLLTMNIPYTRSSGGANRSNRSLAEGLVQRGHDVRVVVPALASPSAITLEQYVEGLDRDSIEVRQTQHSYIFTANGVEVHAVVDPPHLRAYLTDQIELTKPDWILVSSEDPSQNLLSGALQTQPSSVVYLAHTPQMFPFGPASLYPGKARAELVARAATIVTISRFVSDYFREWAGLPTFMNHPPHYGSGRFPHLGRYDAGHVLLMNACAVKGISIFLGLAERMPDVSFAALPGYGTTRADIELLGKLPNVTILKNQKELDDIFARTRALLMPSLWPEGFGMAVVDAMLRGIPVLGSDLGGIPEAKMGTDFVLPVHPIEKYEEQLGENLLPTPIIPTQNIEPWAQALNKLLSNRGLYEDHSAAARVKALQFVEKLTIAPFEEHLKEVEATAGRGKVMSLPREAPGKESPNEKLMESLGNLSSEQLALLSLRLKKKRAIAQGQTQLPIVPVPRNRDLPLSFGQQRLWFFEQLDPGKSIYSRPTAVSLSGALDVDALSYALNEIIRRHEVLRTVYVTEEGRPRQVIKEPEPMQLRVESLNLPAHQQQAEIKRRFREEDIEPFDLERGPVVRARLLRLSAEEHVLVFTVHHIASDGWSTGVMIREVAALYEAFSLGQPSPLPELPIQYVDYAVWQREWL
ncbi:MAG: condensation domain-containing protein, partial [Acidobacteria bacterium]|nr:condensation domain-containing protein [Acidobacteriota bacterium]